jgi:hypothetical protein
LGNLIDPLPNSVVWTNPMPPFGIVEQEDIEIVPRKIDAFIEFFTNCVLASPLGIVIRLISSLGTSDMARREIATTTTSTLQFSN